MHEMYEIATANAIDANMDARDFAPLELTQESESNTMESQIDEQKNGRREPAMEKTPKTQKLFTWRKAGEIGRHAALLL